MDNIDISNWPILRRQEDDLWVVSDPYGKDLKSFYDFQDAQEFISEITSPEGYIGSKTLEAEERLAKLLQLVLTARKAHYEVNRSYAGPGSRDKFNILVETEEEAEDALWDFVDSMPEMVEFNKKSQ